MILCHAGPPKTHVTQPSINGEQIGHPRPSLGRLPRSASARLAQIQPRPQHPKADASVQDGVLDTFVLPEVKAEARVRKDP
jgi:hypothetical protein